MRKLIIAIDGPAASGKSTTARLVAGKLGYLHIDTGAMYRAMTLKVLEQQLHLDDHETIGQLAHQTEIQLRQQEDGLHIFLDSRDVTERIRSQAVTKAASPVSSIKAVREVMVREQRKMGENGGIVLEGRDIGTVVFPNADLKIFLVAQVNERAKRRQMDLKKTGIEVGLDVLADELTKRDEFDSTRKESPLRKADDAILLDTSSMTIDEQVEFIVTKAKEIINHSSLNS
ncbi:MAG: (d)CMP kinase [Ignavibacteriae bacterium]|nr:(d)CMP kinase [Ignavibacteriota bacterium]